jgi:sulfatase modifying factor 1
MNRKGVLKKLSLSLVFVSAVFLQGCGLFGGGGYSDNGELVGVPGREGWYMTVPYGMVPIPAGTFHMGQADEDITASKINFNKQVTIGGFYMDDTEITNNEYRQFITRMLEDSASTLGRDYIKNELYPDTTVWVKDFVHHMGDPMEEYYYMHPAFDDFPVVGVDWEAAKVFSEWRTEYLNAYRASLGEFPMPAFRLPSEAEWEYAARGGRDMAKYPWGNPYIRNSKGCMLANFKPGRGNYFDDGFAYAAEVAQYFANDYGLFDMSGNVSEWCEDAFNPASVPLVWDLNPTFFDESEPRKVIRGGSWKDIAFYLETGTRAYEHKDSTRAFIGFRCAMTYLGRSAGNEF